MEYTKKGDWKAYFDKLGDMRVLAGDEEICCVLTENKREAEANGYLIATAPKMYEALKALWAERVNIGIDKPFWTPHNTEMLQQVIAKAEETD